MQISCEHLDRGRLVEAQSVFGKENCDRIGFFPGGATRDPHSNLFSSLLPFEEPWNFGRECFEGVMVSKEIGNAYEKVLNQRAGLARVLPKETRIAWQAFDSSS